LTSATFQSFDIQELLGLSHSPFCHHPEPLLAGLMFSQILDKSIFEELKALQLTLEYGP
jgi:hypothetical protein